MLNCSATISVSFALSATVLIAVGCHSPQEPEKKTRKTEVHDGQVIIVTEREINTDRPLFEWQYMEADGQRTLIESGPLSDGGKPHGKWTVEDLSGRYGNTYKWWWYGDGVTEAEWHRLADK